MKLKILLFIILCLPLLCQDSFSQARLVLNNNPYIVLNGGTAGTPAYIVVDNPATDAITLATPQVNGGIISESEFNMIKWNIGSGTGNYSIPFTKDAAGPAIPFSANITVAGDAAGNIKFSTYPGATWDNATYMPSDVTNMNSFIGGPNNSSKVIDRFWIADAGPYITKPAVTLTFSYVDAEWGAAGNAVVEGNLGAQRFESPPIGSWGNYGPSGTTSTAANTVSGVSVAPADFFRSWTLVDNTSPLPVELIAFTGSCIHNNILLEWTTATETNNDFFTIEKSNDGVYFHSIGTLKGAGNSVRILDYVFQENELTSSSAYYRIRQTDYNGDTKVSPMIYVTGCSDPYHVVSIYNHGENNFTLESYSSIAAEYQVQIFNSLGQIVNSRIINIPAGYYKQNFVVENLQNAIYFASVLNGEEKILSKKIVVSR